MRAAFLSLLLVFAMPVHADPAEDALRAIAALDAATQLLEAADGGRDRVQALTETILAFEDGLAAIRSGLRGVIQAEDTLTRQLDAREADVARLVGVLQIMGQRPTPQLLLHPEGPTGSARSGMILADVTPALQAEVIALRMQLEDVATLRRLQQDAALRLREGLTNLQNARSDLAQAISARTPLPKRFTADPVQMAVLIAASETLDGFATGLADIASGETPAALPSVATLRGTLKLPVRGTVLRRFLETDAAGISRPGLILATRANALVTAPLSGTVRFEGALLDYGNVMILEPARDVLVVLAGLAEVYVSTGDVVTEGTPLGLMGEAQNTTSGERTETLYIEVRHEDKTVDPELWFAMERN